MLEKEKKRKIVEQLSNEAKVEIANKATVSDGKNQANSNNSDNIADLKE